MMKSHRILVRRPWGVEVWLAQSQWLLVFCEFDDSPELPWSSHLRHWDKIRPTYNRSWKCSKLHHSLDNFPTCKNVPKLWAHVLDTDTRFHAQCFSFQTHLDALPVTFSCVLTPHCLADWTFATQNTGYEPSEIDMGLTHEDEDTNSHMSDIPLQLSARAKCFIW